MYIDYDGNIWEKPDNKLKNTLKTEDYIVIKIATTIYKVYYRLDIVYDEKNNLYYRYNPYFLNLQNTIEKKIYEFTKSLYFKEVCNDCSCHLQK